MSHQRAEFGDFQTPPDLAREVVRAVERLGMRPCAVVEPTCGTGNILMAAADGFSGDTQLLGFDIDPSHVEVARSRASARSSGGNIRVECRDFFATNWRRLFSTLPTPILVIGNPPWVTNAQVGALGGSNVPTKRNFDQHSGLDAITGKANFDISEWMLLRMLEGLATRTAVMAFLCKTAVARKLLVRGVERNLPILQAHIHRIDAAKWFGVSVDACLWVCRLGEGPPAREWDEYASLTPDAVARTMGYRDGALVPDVARHAGSADLEGQETRAWRSGVKHDCSKVMELTGDGRRYYNGLGEKVRIEDDCVFPLLKSTDIYHGRRPEPSRWVILPQRRLGESTEPLQHRAPRTWAYLCGHAERLGARRSSIYTGQPRFAVFGIGPYTFAPWKVAISGLHKHLRFRLVGPLSGRPVVVDDTCYFLPCDSLAEAVVIHAALSSQLVCEFYEARTFWDAKRPVTKRLLQRLDISTLMHELGEGAIADLCAGAEPTCDAAAIRDAVQAILDTPRQGVLFA